jgi:uncharacterized protein (DUF1501 family)
MNRRDFFKIAAPLGIVPMMTRGIPVQAMSATSPFWLNPCNVTDRSIVVVYLNGGNDIFNTTVPLNQLSDYANFRPDVYLPQNQLITLDNTLPSSQQIGLHPVLNSFKQLYDNGLMSIVQGVGHAQPNKSHFKALDNWLTASGGNENYRNGWIGRFLDDRYPSYNGLPFAGELDPLGMLFGRMQNTGFHTFEEHNHEITMSGKDSNGFYSVISSIAGEPILNIPDTEHGSMLSYMQTVADSLNVYSQRVQTTFSNGTNSNSVTYPSTDLGSQMQTIAKMLSGGSRTKVFMATIGGFDTHSDQVDMGSSTTGVHAGLLQDVGDCVKAFQDDLAAQNLDNNVLTVIFSEFGRKIVQNGSYGSDHGTLNSMFFIGKGVEGGVVGNNVDLTIQDNPGAPNPSQTQYDYRQVYSTILQDWLGANNTSIDNIFNDKNGNSYTSMKVPIINNSNIVPSNCYHTPQANVVNSSMVVKVILEGFYNASSSEMSTTLANSASFPTAQPYNFAPYNYQGTESFTTLPADTVDWILLELREADDFSVVVAQKAALLRKDGFVIQTDGTIGVTFDNVTDGDYHLAVFHRNHLGIISSTIVVLDNSSYIYDFTQNEWKAFGNAQTKAIGNVYAMHSGDFNGDNIINNLDYNFHKNNSGSNVGYSKADLDGDGNANSQDYDLWYKNRSKIGALK